MIAQLKELLKLSGGEWLVSFTTRVDPSLLFDKFMGQQVNVDIKKVSKARSKTANDFCWAMCTDIGNSMRPPVPKEEVYRKAIRDVGVYFPIPVRDDLVEEWKRVWSRNGIGWFADVTDKSKNAGYTLMFSYCGSSTYNTEEMSRLIDYLKDEMNQLGLMIPISRDEEQRMLSQWQRAS